MSRSSTGPGEQDNGAGVEYVNGDFLTYDLRPESFDVIVSVAALHHMNPAAALSRMRQLLRPGGTLAVVGLARSRLHDLPADAAGVVAHRVLLVGKRYQEVNAPTHLAGAADLRAGAADRR